MVTKPQKQLGQIVTPRALGYSPDLSVRPRSFWRSQAFENVSKVRPNFPDDVGEQSFTPGTQHYEPEDLHARDCEQVHCIGPDIIRVGFEAADVHRVNFEGHDCDKGCSDED